MFRSKHPGLHLQLSRDIATPSAFPAALEEFGADPLIVCHNDADGLSASAILTEALERVGRPAQVRLMGKGENAYSAEFLRDLARSNAGGVIITDLGVSDVLAGSRTPTILVDHHVPTGIPSGVTVISGINDDPVPTSSLLAYRCAHELGVADGLLWLAALGIIGDMAENEAFPEFRAARSAYGITALRKAAALINAPRRSATGDASAAFALLRKATGPKSLLSGEHPETAALLAAKDEVRRELEAARKAPPRVVGRYALICVNSPCQIHPLLAQTWRGRLRDRIVIAANTGYRPGRVHFAVRTALDLDLLEILESVRPTGADEQYGKGHRAASGGALRNRDWNLFVRALGFGAESEVALTDEAA